VLTAIFQYGWLIGLIGLDGSVPIVSYVPLKIKQLGVGLAVAVILDATVVRCLSVPALMLLVGERNWYMPRWLDRVVPHISIEGAEFFAEPEAVVEPDAAAPA
jgi:uncharacterized membrane protein YdfJ with MMPL/SSD domain